MPIQCAEIHDPILPLAPTALAALSNKERVAQDRDIQLVQMTNLLLRELND